MVRGPLPIVLSNEQRRELEGLIRRRSTPQHLALRARIVVLADDGLGVGDTAARIGYGLWRKGVSQWRARWLASSPGTPVVERRLGCAALGGHPRVSIRRRPPCAAL